MYRVRVENPGNALVSVKTDHPDLQKALDHAISLVREGLEVEISSPVRRLYTLCPDYNSGLTTANVVIRRVGG